MAIPWVTVLQLVPWTEVIRNAPAVLDSARKLWDTAARKSGTQATGATPAAGVAVSPEARVDALEATVASLNEQVLASSTLIKELAEQNANLIRRAEMNRVLVLRLGYCLAIVGLLSLVAISLALKL
ncbi:MAG: hypothetical protein MUC71_00270 [Steroidobacteraceae bacterium]|jgi:hypothetical protein|nr:hypothetical protein [Steroidobacteraceae bacterium]